MTPRSIFVLMVLAIAAVFGYALYTQYVDGLEPCPLCMTQRFFYVLTAAFALLGALHLKRSAIYGGLIVASALGGGAVAARQVWLQHLPADQVPACGPSLEYMFQTLPFGEVLLRMFKGDGNCALIDWQFLGLSMAEWSLFCFVLLAMGGVWQLCRSKVSAPQ